MESDKPITASPAQRWKEVSWSTLRDTPGTAHHTYPPHQGTAPSASVSQAAITKGHSQWLKATEMDALTLLEPGRHLPLKAVGERPSLPLLASGAFPALFGIPWFTPPPQSRSLPLSSQGYLLRRTPVLLDWGPPAPCFRSCPTI